MDIYGLESTESVICLATTKNLTTTYHVLRINSAKNELTCQTCRSASCSHLKYLKEQSDHDSVAKLLDLRSKVKETARYVPVCLSRQKIPFSINTTQSSEITSSLDPECQCGADCEETVTTVPLFNLNKVVEQEGICCNVLQTEK